MYILLCNVGSTSLKFKLYDMPSEALVVESKFERIGEDGYGIIFYRNNRRAQEVRRDREVIPDFNAGIRLFLKLLQDVDCGAVATMKEVSAVGFKAPHGKSITGAHLVDEHVLEAMEDYSIVSPLHVPNYIRAMRLFQEIVPTLPLVAVFETTFHQTMPAKAYTYGIPAAWKADGFRRYGFHGNSHSYIASQLGIHGGEIHYRAISCHMGGSTSLCAILDGKSQDCSFGFSAQSGIDHAQRNGDLDVFIPLYRMLRHGDTPEEISYALNYEAGLKGISGIGTDMRDIQKAAAQGNEDAQLAVEVYCYEIVKYIGAYYAVLGGLDYLVFTGGIGENAPDIRQRICEQLPHLGIEIDAARNLGEIGDFAEISGASSKVRILVIPTNEEIGIAREAYHLIQTREGS